MVRRRLRERDAKLCTPDEVRFIAAYMRTSNKKEALEQCGLAPGSNVLTRPHVQAAIEGYYEEEFDKHAITADAVLGEMAKIAFANVDDFINDDMSVNRERPSRGVMAAVKKVKVKRSRRGEDDEFEVEDIEIEMYDKLAALDKLARHLGVYNDTIKIEGDLAERLTRAYERAAIEPPPAPEDKNQVGHPPMIDVTPLEHDERRLNDETN